MPCLVCPAGLKCTGCHCRDLVLSSTQPLFNLALFSSTFFRFSGSTYKCFDSFTGLLFFKLDLEKLLSIWKIYFIYLYYIISCISHCLAMWLALTFKCFLVFKG